MSVWSLAGGRWLPSLCLGSHSVGSARDFLSPNANLGRSDNCRPRQTRLTLKELPTLLSDLESLVEIFLSCTWPDLELWICLKQKLRTAAGSLTPAQVVHSSVSVLVSALGAAGRQIRQVATHVRSGTLLEISLCVRSH